MLRIGLLEDEEHTAGLIKLWVEAAGFACDVFGEGRKLINALKRESYDLLIIDWIVPDIDGEGVLRWVRENIDWPIPVIFVTQRDAEEDVVKILLLGADDYLTKPVRERELLARLTALARRAHLVVDGDEQVQTYGSFTIDHGNRTVARDGEVIKLTQKEFELVQFLFRNIGRILSRGHILESVWGHKADLATRTADTHISRVRNKLGLVPENGWRISSIYHHGYRLEHLENSD